MIIDASNSNSNDDFDLTPSYEDSIVEPLNASTPALNDDMQGRYSRSIFLTPPPRPRRVSKKTDKMEEYMKSLQPRENAKSDTPLEAENSADLVTQDQENAESGTILEIGSFEDLVVQDSFENTISPCEEDNDLSFTWGRRNCFSGQ